MRVKSTSVGRADWDDFAQRCGASFRCSYRGARAWQFEDHWFHRLHRLDLFIQTGATEIKFGQCAVGVGRQQSVFSDGLQLLPEFGGLWSKAMVAVLDRLGPATYVYGSEWSLERPREAELARLERVRIVEVSSTSLEVIDFNAWPSLDRYLRAMSENARRNSKKATVAFPGMSVQAGGSGFAGLRRYAAALSMRSALFRRKGLRRSTAKMLLRSIARAWSMGPHRRQLYLVHDGKLLAFHSGIAFGTHWYFLEGAAVPESGGAAWHLLIRAIEHAFTRSGGKGRFVMGSDDGTKTGDAWDGLRRSRRQCRTTPFPTSVVRFTYVA